MDSLACPEPSQPTESLIWYFAYGSMCNPISLKRRGILPRASLPVKVADYRLVFTLAGGMANMEVAPGQLLQGILHQVTNEMFERLKEIEAVYEVVDVECLPYESGAGPITAKAFTVPPGKQPPAGTTPSALPSERYVTIILQGLCHYGASEDWISVIEAQPFTPARCPKQYRQLPPAANPASLPLMSRAQLAQHKGQLPAVYAIGRKVVRADTSSNPSHPMVQVLRDLMAGTDAGYGMCMNLYEPRLPELNSPADMTQEHLDWVEDLAMDMQDSYGFKLEQIAWLQEEDTSQEPLRPEAGPQQQQQPQQVVATAE